jgi:hypothetical protein
MKQKLPQHSSTQPRTQLANTICVFLWWLFIYSCAKFAYLSFVPKIKNYRIIMQANTTQHTNTKHKTHNKQHEPPPPYPPAALPSIPMAQMKALRLPVSPLQAPGGEFTITAACSFA